MRLISLLTFFCAVSIFGGKPIDLKQIPLTNEMYIVAVDVKFNPTSMPAPMLWDDPIMLVYRQVPNFNNVRVDDIRQETIRDLERGDYKPVVVRARQNTSLTLHFMNLIGTGDAPERVVQGVVCKRCKKANYVFTYGPGGDENLYPYKASIHSHGIAYTIENDGTNAGYNPLMNPDANGLVAPGETRSYHYHDLDFPGVWPMHDHANPSHGIGRGLHMALVVEPENQTMPLDHDFLMIFSDYPDYDQYIDDFYAELLIPPFLHMKNGNVMHTHALNGYAAMLTPRGRMAVMNGGTPYDAMRSDLAGEPRTPVFEVEMGDLVRFRLLSMGSATTHSFHLHGHVWYDRVEQKHVDNIAVASGSHKDIVFYAGGPPYHLANNSFVSPFKVRSGPGDWLYHCHIVPHVKHGMWGIFRVLEKTERKEAGVEIPTIKQ